MFSEKIKIPIEKRGYTGKMFEEDFVGSIPKGADYRSALLKLQEKSKKNGYVGFNDSVDLVKKFQPWDPTNPGKDFARDLRIEVIDRLNLAKEEDMEKVRFYTAVGSPLDVFHGVDAFLEYADKEGEIHRVTFDLSLDSEKEERRKADLVVKELSDPQTETEKYLEEVAQIAEKAAALIAEKKEIKLAA